MLEIGPVPETPMFASHVGCIFDVVYVRHGNVRKRYRRQIKLAVQPADEPVQQRAARKHLAHDGYGRRALLAKVTLLRPDAACGRQREEVARDREGTRERVAHLVRRRLDALFELIKVTAASRSHAR